MKRYIIRLARAAGFWLFGQANRLDPDTKVTAQTITANELRRIAEVEQARMLSIIQAEDRRIRRESDALLGRAFPEGEL